MRAILTGDRQFLARTGSCRISRSANLYLPCLCLPPTLKLYATLVNSHHPPVHISLFYPWIVWEVSFTTFCSTQAVCPRCVFVIWCVCIFPRSIIKAELLALLSRLTLLLSQIFLLRLPRPRPCWWREPGAAPCCWTWPSPGSGLAHTSGSDIDQCSRWLENSDLQLIDKPCLNYITF